MIFRTKHSRGCYDHRELLLICGELNLGLKINKKTDNVEDPYNFLGWLKKNDIKLIMDPFHDTAVRYEPKHQNYQDEFKKSSAT